LAACVEVVHWDEQRFTGTKADYPYYTNFARRQNRYCKFLTASVATLAKPLLDFTFSLPCLFPLCLVSTLQIPSGSRKGIKKMGRYQTEAAYLKSVLLWLQGNWAEPDPPRFYPLKEVNQDRRTILSGGLMRRLFDGTR
jgi:hypothetical protein